MEEEERRVCWRDGDGCVVGVGWKAWAMAARGVEGDGRMEDVRSGLARRLRARKLWRSAMVTMRRCCCLLGGCCCAAVALEAVAIFDGREKSLVDAKRKYLSIEVPRYRLT